MSFDSILSVSVAPTNVEFTTLQNTKDDLGQFTTDPIILRYIDQATSEIVSFLNYREANPLGGSSGHPIAETGYSETFRMTHYSESLLLSRRFLVAAPVISEDGVNVAAADIETDYGAGIVFRLSNGVRAAFRGSVIIASYTAGYKMPADTTVTAPSRRMPESLERATIDLVAYRFTLATGQPCGSPMKSISLPGAGALGFDLTRPQTDSRAMPGQVAALLEPYRNYRV
jgi:hypothetical protein